MNIQDLRIDNFLIEVQNAYRDTSIFFDKLAEEEAASAHYREIELAYRHEIKKIPEHIKAGEFRSSQSKEKVLNDLSKAQELICDLPPEADSFVDYNEKFLIRIDKLVRKIAGMKANDN